MKKVILFVFSLLTISAFGQREFEMTEGDTSYIMKKYFMCFLKRGPVQSKDSLERAQNQELHLNHLNKLSESGKLIVAGPFETTGDLRGILIFDVDTEEEVYKLEGEDPAVKKGIFIIEVLPWWTAKGVCLN